MLKIYAGTTPDKVGDLMKVIGDVLGDMNRDSVSDEELCKGKEQIKGSLLINFDSTDFRLTRLASNEMYFGTNILPEEVSKQIDGVTKDDVFGFADLALAKDSTVVTAIGNISEKDLELGELI